jgi:GntR family transcriptional regulator
MTSTVQPYRQIATSLRDRILSGELGPGAVLPSANDLARATGHARATAAKALELLRGEGLIVTSQGAQARVRMAPTLTHTATGENFRNRQRRSAAANDVAEAALQGHQGRNELLRVGDVLAPREVAELLGVPAGTVVVERAQLHRVDGKPMKTMTCYFRQGLAAGTPLAERRLIRGGVSRLLEDPDGPFRRSIASMDEIVIPRPPLPDEAELLCIPEGVSVAYVLRTTYDISGEVLEVLASVLPGDRYRLRYVVPIPPRR